MDEPTKPTPYIFYLQLKPLLPAFFFKISEEFSKYGVKLIPIRFDDLMAISKESRVPLVTVNPSLKTNQVLGRYRRRYLDLSIINNKYIHFDVSSFRPAESLHKNKWVDRYIHLKLPQDIEELSRGIMKVINLEKRRKQVWPGGSNGKPPSYQDII